LVGEGQLRVGKEGKPKRGPVPLRKGGFNRRLRKRLEGRGGFFLEARNIFWRGTFPFIVEGEVKEFC